MKKTTARMHLVASTALALLASGAALSEVRDLQEVLIDPGQAKASGALGSARNSSDTLQEISCGANVVEGRCFARDSAGAFVECKTGDAEMIATMRMVGGDSLLTFKWNPASADSSGVFECIEIIVNVSSRYVPKAP